MKTLIALLLCSALPAYAGPHDTAITNMTAQCRCVMEGGVCQVTNSPPPKPGSKVFTPAGPIPAEVYNAIRSKGALMCQEGAAACTANWDGQECRAGFRLMFRQEPTVCVPG